MAAIFILIVAIYIIYQLLISYGGITISTSMKLSIGMFLSSVILFTVLQRFTSDTSMVFDLGNNYLLKEKINAYIKRLSLEIIFGSSLLLCIISLFNYFYLKSRGVIIYLSFAIGLIASVLAYFIKLYSYAFIL